MARALADIITELGSVYNPQRQRAEGLYNQQFGELAPQETADLGGLEQAKTNAFSDINTGANRRGMFFSGIPLAEQAKYVGENYLPSIASLKNRYAGIRGNLYQTLASTLGDIDVKQREFGQGIFNQEVQQDIERERIAAAERDAAASRAASAGSGGGFVPGGATSGTSRTGSTGTTADPATLQIKSTATAQVAAMRARANTPSFYQEVEAISKSAGYGNPLDQAKLELLQSQYPGLFKNGQVNTSRTSYLAGAPANTSQQNAINFYQSQGGQLPGTGNSGAW